MERKSTGIPQLDELVEGGLKERTITLVEGDAGSGKSTLAIQYLLSGMQEGENVIYLSVEESRESFFDNMSRFGFPLEEMEKTQKFEFHEMTAQKLREFIEKGVLGIEDQISSRNIKRLVVDSISAFALQYEGEAKQRTAVIKLFDKIKNWGLTTLIIAEASHDYSQFGLQYLVDGWIKMCYKKTGQERIRTIEVIKMRGTKHKATEVVYKIEDNGISLYPGERIFDYQQ
jgi:circadian clock protein KaiC